MSQNTLILTFLFFKEISDFCRCVKEIFYLLGCYAA